MADLEKYRGVIPAFYACYDDAGEISPERTRTLARYLIDKGVKAYMCAVRLENVSTRVCRSVKLRWNM